MSSPQNIPPLGEDPISSAAQPPPQPPPAAPPPPLPPDNPIEDDIEEGFVNVGQAALWLPQSGVDRHGLTVNREAPVNRHRHWSASGEVPPRIPNHSRFDNWPPATRFNSAALASQPPHPAAPTQSEASGSSPSPPAVASPNTHHNSEHFQDILLQSSPPQGFLDLTYVHDEILSDDHSEDAGGQVGGENDVGDTDARLLHSGENDVVGTDALLLHQHDDAGNLPVAEDLYISHIITPPIYQGGAMSQDDNNPRTLAGKEVLNLDPDAKASIDIAVANNVIPNPRPWFFPQHSAFFPDKSVL